jgi:hypothetical protein
MSLGLCPAPQINLFYHLASYPCPHPSSPVHPSPPTLAFFSYSAYPSLSLSLVIGPSCISHRYMIIATFLKSLSLLLVARRLTCALDLTDSLNSDLPTCLYSHPCNRTTLHSPHHTRASSLRLRVIRLAALLSPAWQIALLHLLPAFRQASRSCLRHAPPPRYKLLLTAVVPDLYFGVLAAGKRCRPAQFTSPSPTHRLPARFRNTATSSALNTHAVARCSCQFFDAADAREAA